MHPLSAPPQLPLPPFRPKPILVPELPLVDPGERDVVRRLRLDLQASGTRMMNATELVRALAKRDRQERIPTTLSAFDSLLGGGLPRGKVIELSGRRGGGRYSIVLAALAAATSMGEAAVLVDLGDHFDPQVAEASGIDLQRLLWIRPESLKDAVMAAEMITTTGFQLVTLDAGSHRVRGRRVHDAAWVRLARSAEAEGAAMLISTPYPLTGTASEAVVRTGRSRIQWLGNDGSSSQQWRVIQAAALELTLEKHRHLRAGTHATQMFVASESIPGTVGVPPENRRVKSSSKFAFAHPSPFTLHPSG